MKTRARKVRIGIFDHTGPSLGGGALVAAHLASCFAQLYSVDLIRDWNGLMLNQISSAFSFDLAKVVPLACEEMWESFGVPGRRSLLQQIRRSRVLTADYDLFICAGHWVPPFCQARHGILYCHFPIGLPGWRELQGDERWARRNRIDRWLRLKGYQLEWLARLKSYDRILANSAFTAGWMERRWGVRAEVVYPPVELDVPEVQKQNRIVSIGRFFGTEPRRKGHLAQVQAFREFLARVPEHWEMWMVGSCHSDKDRAYLSVVQDAARDLPIRFLVNVDRDTVIHALAGAKVFWHTAGLFERKDEDPVSAEHFGIATVEAMRAGCVPIVVDSGGQREIIVNGVNGILCEGIHDLVGNSVAVSQSGSRLSSLAGAAERRSLEFSGHVFDRKILEIVKQTLSRRSKVWGTHSALSLLAQAPTTPASLRRLAG